MRTMISRAAAIVLFLACAALPALADEQSEALLNDFIAWIDSSAQWDASVSFIRSDGNDTYAEGVIFSRADPHVSVSIETLRLRGLKARDGGGFMADEIDMGGADIVANDLRYTIPSASVENVSAPSVEGLVFNPRQLMTLAAQAYSALAKAEFTNLAIPEMTGSSERVLSPTSGETITTRLVYNDMAIASLKNGVAEGMETGPVTLRIDGPDGDADIMIRSASSDRFNVGAFAHVFDPAAYVDGRGDRIWRPIVSNMTYSGISGIGPDGFTFALDALVVEDLDGRQLDQPFTPTWDALLDLAVPEDDKPALALDLLRSYGAWRLGAMRFEGLSVEAPTESARFSVDDLTVSGISSDGIDSFEMRGLEGKAREGFVRLRSLELKDFVSPDLEALIEFTALKNDIDEDAHADAIANTFAGLPRFNHFGMHVLVGGKDERDQISLESLTLDFSEWNDVFAEATDLRLTGLDVPPHLLGPETAQLLDTLGFDDLVLGVSLSDRWSPEAGTDDATWTFSLGDAADFELSYQLTGVTMDWIVRATASAGETRESEEAVMAMLDELKLERASFSVTDRSLLERAFAFAADVQSLDVDGATYRKQMQAALPFLISAAMPPAITKLLAKPLQQFLAGGQTLIAEIVPPAPLNVTEFLAKADDPLALPDRLNMTLRTEEPAQ